MKSEVDKKIEEYDGYYEEIFKEFKKEVGNIIVEFKDLNEYKQKTFIPILLSVNNLESPDKFNKKLIIIKENSLKVLNKILNNPQVDKNLFLKILNIQIKELNKLTFLHGPYFVDDGFTGVDELYLRSFSDRQLIDVRGIIFENFEESDLIKDKDIQNFKFKEEEDRYCQILVRIIEEFKEEVNKKLSTTEISNEYKFISDITWEGTDTDLIEIITALVKTGTLKYKSEYITRKNAIKLIGDFFNRPIKNPDKLLSVATNRKISQAPFLEKLKKAFIAYCKEMDEKDLPKNQ